VRYHKTPCTVCGNPTVYSDTAVAAGAVDRATGKPFKPGQELDRCDSCGAVTIKAKPKPAAKPKSKPKPKRKLTPAELTNQQAEQRDRARTSPRPAGVRVTGDLANNVLGNIKTSTTGGGGSS
jgi:hypothetical protein